MGVIKILVFGCVCLLATQGQATTLYVRTDSPAPAPPFGSWETAAHTIQDAVDAATAGDTVRVADGVYASGGRCASNSTLTNRVCIEKDIAVVSVNGAYHTTICGVGSPGSSAVRCVFLGTNAQLTGFTLTGGGVTTNAWSWQFVDAAGGGAYCQSGASLNHCVISSNTVPNVDQRGGGGVFGGTLNDCTLFRNSAMYGGGSLRSTLNRCRLTENMATYGGGASEGSLINCILVSNYALCGGASSWAELIHCTLYRNEAATGAATYGGSAINTMTWGTPLTVSPFSGTITDHCWNGDPACVNPDSGDFRLRECSPCIDAGAPLSATATDFEGTARPQDGDFDGVATVDIGAFERISHPHFASPSGGGVPPYTNWATAATRIQDAVDAAGDDDTVFVGPGTYDPSSGSADGTNLVLLEKLVTLRASTTAAQTILDGNGALRGVRLTAAGRVVGFTIRNCRVNDGGGGISGTSGGTIESCILTGNVAANGHGGAINLVGGCIRDCLIVGNIASNSANLKDGGGVFSYGSTLYNCTVVGNRCGRNGAGVYLDLRANTDNVLRNCIVYDNSAPTADIVAGNSGGSGSLIQDYSCSPCLVTGTGNITNRPGFADAPAGNYRLLGHSRCIDAGIALQGSKTDLDGYPRPIDGNGDGVSGQDMGVYEYPFQSPADAHYVWQNGLDIAPYTNWLTAAHSIQSAVDVASTGGRVIVMDGEYLEDGRVAPGGGVTNRVFVDKTITLSSVNGPDVTTIRGIRESNSLARCLYIATNAYVSGFTLTKGCTIVGAWSIMGPWTGEDGGGAWCASGATLVNCIMSRNQGNSGGGVCAQPDALIDRCTMDGNYAFTGGGGNGGVYRNCVVINNQADYGLASGSFAGIYDAQSVRNCTGCGNVAESERIDFDAREVRNCIALGGVSWRTTAENTMTSGDPMFVDGYRLSPGSPCIDAGNSAWVTTDTDADGNRRIVNGQVDLGAYEYTNADWVDSDDDGIPNWWEQQYFGGTNACDETFDSDEDGMSNWAEWRAGTDPNNAMSRFAVRQIVHSPAGNALLSWGSLSNRFYSIWGASNLNNAAGFHLLCRDVAATPPMNVYTAATSADTGRMYYQVRVEN